MAGHDGASTLAPAVVLGDLDLVRPLRRAGIPCAVVARPGKPAAASRQAVQLGWADPWRAPGALLDLLLRFAATAPEPPVLYYQLDAYTTFVSRHRDRLSQAYRFVLADDDVLADCVDKVRFQQRAEALRLPVPRTAVLRPSAPAPDVGALRFPLVLKPSLHKPASEDDAGWKALAHGRKALEVADRPQLDALWPALADRGADVVAQELVPGPESRIESYHAYVRNDGAVAAEFTGRKIRTLPRVHGETTACVVTPIDDVRDVGREVLKALRLTGVAKADFKRAPDGRLVLLEVNPRFNLWHHPGAVAGTNLPAMVWSDLTGHEVPQVPPGRGTATWSNHWDARAAREWGVPPLEWLRWTWRCDTRSLGAVDDPRPLVRAATRVAGRALRGVRRRG
ncbi:MAG: ATP-grasp domain-containing protein [Actinomycetes bacterium]